MLLLGCGSADAVCTVGEALACSCPDGREGITECDGLGQPGACVCDQVGPEAAAWSRRLGDEREQSLIALAPTGDGIVVVGAFEGVLEVGGVPLVSAGSRDIFVASFGPGGAHRWSRSYGGPGDDFARAVAVDAEGSIYVAGGFSDEIRIVADDPIVLTAEGETDAFVMRLRASGETRWARSWGSLGLDAFTRVTLVEGATQNVLYLGGYYQLTLTYEGGVLAPSGGTDVMVARLSEEDGSPVFFAHIGGGGNDAVGGIATNGADFYVAGGYQGFDMGLPNSPEGNAFVFGFDATGTPQNSSYFRGAGRDDARDAAIAGGQLWIAGRFEDQLEPLATPETIEAVGGQDIFLTPFVGGAFGVVQTFGDAGREEVTSLTSDGDALLMAGGFDGSLDFGLGAMQAVGRGDGYVVRVEGTTGAPLQQALVSSTGFAQVESAAFDPATDRWWVAGRFDGTLTIGDDTLVSVGQSDLFVAALRPQ